MILVFKLFGVRHKMKEYLQFLHWHHYYSQEELLEAFPEYLELIKPDKNSKWRYFF